MWSNGCQVEGDNRFPQPVGCPCSSHRGCSWSAAARTHCWSAAARTHCSLTSSLLPTVTPRALPAELLPCQAVPSLCPARGWSTQGAGLCLCPCWIPSHPGPCGWLPCPLVCQLHHPFGDIHKPDEDALTFCSKSLIKNSKTGQIPAQTHTVLITGLQGEYELFIAAL